mgnify:CR=1 FL=1
MEKDFNLFMSQLTETNATLDFFVDFNKIRENVGKIKLKLNQLNYLIGHENIEEAIKEIFEENPKTFEVLDILIATRSKDKKQVINKNMETVLINSYYKNAESVYTFIKETGLEEVFKNKDITNLVDYVFGIEVGLDTNARKNRGGTLMQDSIASIFEKNSIPFEAEVYSTSLEGMISLGDDLKRFDFVVKTKRKTYLMEVNYYNGGGSKLNETARAYTDIAPKINANPLYEFVWITDGKGWESAKTKLQEAYTNIDNIYNLTSIKGFLEKVKSEL